MRPSPNHLHVEFWMIGLIYAASILNGIRLLAF